MAKIKQIQIGEDTFDLGVNAENIDGYITEIPIASSQTLGGIKVGDNLEITEDGTLSAVAGGSSITYVIIDTKKSMYRIGENQNITSGDVFDTVKNFLANKPEYFYIILRYNNYGVGQAGDLISVMCKSMDNPDIYTEGNHNLTFFTGGTLTDTGTGTTLTYMRGMACIRTMLTYNVSNGVVTLTKINIEKIFPDAYLTKDNTSSYTPTANYHPATKKYVDDAIASAITTTLGGEY